MRGRRPKPEPGCDPLKDSLDAAFVCGRWVQILEILDQEVFSTPGVRPSNAPGPQVIFGWQRLCKNCISPGPQSGAVSLCSQGNTLKPPYSGGTHGPSAESSCTTGHQARVGFTQVSLRLLRGQDFPQAVRAQSWALLVAAPLAHSHIRVGGKGHPVFPREPRTRRGRMSGDCPP